MGVIFLGYGESTRPLRRVERKPAVWLVPLIFCNGVTGVVPLGLVTLTPFSGLGKPQIQA